MILLAAAPRLVDMIGLKGRIRSQNMVRRFLTSVCLLSLLPVLPGLCQSLADQAKKEREKRQGKSKKVYTNDDLNKYENLRSSVPASPTPQPSDTTSKPAKSALTGPDDSSERVWSKRFIEANARVQ